MQMDPLRPAGAPELPARMRALVQQAPEELRLEERPMRTAPDVLEIGQPARCRFGIEFLQIQP